MGTWGWVGAARLEVYRAGRLGSSICVSETLRQLQRDGNTPLKWYAVIILILLPVVWRIVATCRAPVEGAAFF